MTIINRDTWSKVLILTEQQERRLRSAICDGTINLGDSVPNWENDMVLHAQDFTTVTRFLNLRAQEAPPPLATVQRFINGLDLSQSLRALSRFEDASTLLDGGVADLASDAILLHIRMLLRDHINSLYSK